MPTPEVTGSAALQSKEIKKIVREYAEYCCPESSYDGDIVERNMDLRICADEALPTLEWLSNDYCIVPKSLLKEHYEDVCEDIRDYDGKGVFGIGCADMTMYQRARGMKQMLYRLFGKELFEEGRE